MSKDQLQEFESIPIISRGGWDSNNNWLEINQVNPGMASSLINFEPSLFGGYRRINGFEYLEDTDTGYVDSAGAEGKILGVAFYKGDIIAARKQQSGATYELYKWVANSTWSKYTTGLTLVSTGVNRVRYATFNFEGVETIIFADGVNNAYMYNNSTWTKIDPADTGLDYANAGGLQALAAPSNVWEFENHVFMSGDSSYPHIVAHSAPYAPYDWLVANGAGQINTGLIAVNMIRPFRENLYVFSREKIKRIYVENTSFAIKNVTEKVGCLAGCSVVELNGDLVFLSEDGFRPVSATERIGDVEIATISKPIQNDVKNLIKEYAGTDIIAVEVPSKSQFRCFFTPSSVTDNQAIGILGGLVDAGSPNVRWEWAKLKGIKISCAAHGHSGATNEEYIIHGTHDGKVMRQEVGNSFNGENIRAQYVTPYIDFQTPGIRKTVHEIMLFTKPEGAVTINCSLSFDWNSYIAINPSPGYEFETIGGSGDVYGTAIYGTATYGSNSITPVMVTNMQGSGKSFQLGFSTDDTSAPYTIQGFVTKYKNHGYN